MARLHVPLSSPSRMLNRLFTLFIEYFYHTLCCATFHYDLCPSVLDYTLSARCSPFQRHAVLQYTVLYYTILCCKLRYTVTHCTIVLVSYVTPHYAVLQRVPNSLHHSMDLHYTRIWISITKSRSLWVERHLRTQWRDHIKEGCVCIHILCGLII